MPLVEEVVACRRPTALLCAATPSRPCYLHHSVGTPLPARTASLARHPAVGEGMRSRTAVHRRQRTQPWSTMRLTMRLCRSTPVSWAWLDLNQRPHPYQACSRDAFMLEKRDAARSVVGWQ